MKKLFLTLLILTFGTIRIYADCSSSNISVWPKGTEINSNSIFIIQGYGTSQDIIRGLNIKYKVYLKSKNSIVPVEIIKVYEGQYSLTQAILKPKSQLIEGKTYTLQISNLEDYEKEDYYQKKIKWTVNNKKDIDLPYWSAKPKYENKQKINYGCGPAKFIDFCACINDSSPVVVFTKLTEEKTGKTAEYFITPDSTFLRIGHGMCSGAFEFEDGEHYKISFSLMDASGNRNDTLTNEINFISPTDNDGERFNEKVLCNCPKAKESEVSSIKLLLSICLSVIMIIAFIIFIKRKKASH